MHTHCTDVRLYFDQLDYRIEEGTNNNLLRIRVTVKTVENQNVDLARELKLKITPLTFQQQEALGIPLPPDFPPKPAAASGNLVSCSQSLQIAFLLLLVVCDCFLPYPNMGC